MKSNASRAEDAAATWDARLRGGQTSYRDRQDFHDWLKQHPDNQAAHDRLQAALAVLRAHADLPEVSALRDEARNSVQENRRRWIARAVATAATLVLAVILVLTSQKRPGMEVADPVVGETIYATSSHERTRVTLADGSVVTLDAGARLSARLGPSRRDVTLLAGRALFEVAKDARRPFVVKARDRTITALGTTFDVRVSQAELRVTLAEGAVAVRPVRPGRGARQQLLKPSEQFVERTGVPTPSLLRIDAEQALGWADGRVFFDNEPLVQAVEEMNRYSELKIMVDPAVADLRISGMFRTGNQDGFSQALGTALPVHVRHGDDGRILVTAAANTGE